MKNLLILVLFAPLVANGQTALTDEVDVEYILLKSTIRNAQTSYLASKTNKNVVKRYFQVLPTTTEPAKDGEAKQPENLATKPSYQDKTTLELLPAFNKPLKAQYEIHQYQSGKKLGYYVIIRVKETIGKKEVTWIRIDDPSDGTSSFNHGWQQINPILP